MISVSALELLRLETDKTETSVSASQGPKQNCISQIAVALLLLFSLFSNNSFLFSCQCASATDSCANLASGQSLALSNAHHVTSTPLNAV